MKFDRAKFYDGWRDHFGPLAQTQVDGCEALLAALEADPQPFIQWMAYELATTYHETAHTMQPIEEYGKGHGHPYGVPDPVTGQTYYGRGFVQLTWKKNYQKMSDLLSIDLVNEPDLAMRPDIAFSILNVGMRDGLFTGKKLSDYITADKADYYNARRIINGLDRADWIAGYARAIEAMLINSVEDTDGP